MPSPDAPSSVPSPTPGRDFDQAWKIAEGIPGWVKEGQARLLFDEARLLAAGARVVEIGSHQGRSSVVLAMALEPLGGRVICVDPFVEGRLFGGTPTRAKFERHIAEAGVADTVDLRAEFSATPPVLVRVVRHALHRRQARLLDPQRRPQVVHAPPGRAPILVHDSFSSIGVTLGLLAHVLPTRTLRYDSRSDSMALFRKSRPTPADRWRILREPPGWIRNVGIKVLLRLRLRGVARLFGHDSPYDPY